LIVFDKFRVFAIKDEEIAASILFFINSEDVKSIPLKSSFLFLVILFITCSVDLSLIDKYSHCVSSFFMQSNAKLNP
jgi:hypothetical protein